MPNQQFTKAPTIEQPRSKFMRNSTHKTTFNAGKLVPIYVDEVLPGDTFNISMAGVVRASTPYQPVMDTAYIDTYAFFVPNRLVWDGWEEFMGANKTDFWKQKTQKKIPMTGNQANTNNGVAWDEGTIADHFGLPVGVGGLEVSALPFRAYAMIWNEFFRDQNLQAPIHIDKGDNFAAHYKPSDPMKDDIYEDSITGGTLLPVNKYHDYFTSCLPEAQKGDSQELPLKGLIPVFAGLVNQKTTDMTDTALRSGWGLASLNYGAVGRKDQNIGYSGGNWDSHLKIRTTDLTTAETHMSNSATSVSGTELGMYPKNLYADLSGGNPVFNKALGGDAIKGADINDLRLAFQIQKALERDARSGTRYTEMVEAHFGVSNPDARLQRPEFLGGAHTPISQTQVEQTTGGSGTKFNTDKLGTTGAYSLTSMQEQMAMKSFTEHGHVIILAAVRTEQTYQQNIEKMWSRKERFHFYHPVFANLGEQKVLQKELISRGNTADDEVFGFQEHWAEYRFKPSKVSGKFNSAATDTLDAWHYAPELRLQSHTYLDDKFIRQGATEVDRTIIVKHTKAPQYIADFYIQNETTRTMPLYSVPGLIDHN